MAAIFSFIGFLGVLIGAAAAGAGLYETFGETQKAVDAWVSGAQVFFSGAMLMALGSVAARVRGTTRAVDDLAKAVRSLRGELTTAAAAAIPPAASSATDEEPLREQGGRRREPEADLREPVLERRVPATAKSPDRKETSAAAAGTPRRATRLGPALDDVRGSRGEAAPRSGRLRRPFDDE